MQMPKNIRHVILSRQNIKFDDNDICSNYNHLEEFDFYTNYISKIRTRNFKSCYHLKTLSLKNNRIYNLEDEIFR